MLKPTGSLYLHCDPTASHYLKILLDALFGPKCFRNEIVWDYSFRLMDLPRFFNRKHDIILFYAKSKQAIYNMPKSAWTKEELLASRKQAVHLDEAGVEWIWMPGGKGHSKNKLRRVDDILAGGKAMSDVWPLPILSSSSKEWLGYPTQKPVSLLERIVAASSNPGDVVLDPFCGCGTAVHAAQKLGRWWIGIDITYLSIGLIERRLREAFAGIAFDIVGEPQGRMDAEHLAASEPYQFQYWITQKIGGQPYQGGRKGADRGIDGYVYYTHNDPASARSATAAAIVSVKAGRNVGPTMIRDLVGVLDREKADLGIFVCVADPTAQMRAEAASEGIWADPVTGIGYRRVQIFTLDDLFAGRMPKMPLLDRQSGYRRAPREASGAAQARLL